MTSFAHLNLRDIENGVPAEIDGVEGRFSRTLLDSRDLGVSLFTFAPEFHSPTGHRHREQEEAYVVVSGGGRMLIGDEVIDLRMWDVVRVAPEVVRAFEAGPDGLEVIAVGGPKPEGGDGEPAEITWPGETAA